MRAERDPDRLGHSTGAVGASIEELQPNTTYHWRLSVTDADGEAYASDHAFVYPTTGVELPDGRAYELVSPPFEERRGARDGVRYAPDRDR